jgi:hypothetical protein
MGQVGVIDGSGGPGDRARGPMRPLPNCRRLPMARRCRRRLTMPPDTAPRNGAGATWLVSEFAGCASSYGARRPGCRRPTGLRVWLPAGTRRTRAVWLRRSSSRWVQGRSVGCLVGRRDEGWVVGEDAQLGAVGAPAVHPVPVVTAPGAALAAATPSGSRRRDMGPCEPPTVERPLAMASQRDD